MKLTLSDGSVWTAHFHHQFLTEEQAARKPYYVVTTCRLHTGTCAHLGENDACVRTGYTGVSCTSKMDNFVKSYGRFLALQRALKQVDHKLGREIFQAYWAKSPSQGQVGRVRRLYSTHAEGGAHAA